VQLESLPLFPCLACGAGGRRSAGELLLLASCLTHSRQSEKMCESASQSLIAAGHSVRAPAAAAAAAAAAAGRTHAAAAAAAAAGHTSAVGSTVAGYTSAAGGMDLAAAVLGDCCPCLHGYLLRMRTCRAASRSLCRAPPSAAPPPTVIVCVSVCVCVCVCVLCTLWKRRSTAKGHMTYDI